MTDKAAIRPAQAPLSGPAEIVKAAPAPQAEEEHPAVLHGDDTVHLQGDQAPQAPGIPPGHVVVPVPILVPTEFITPDATGHTPAENFVPQFVARDAIVVKPQQLETLKQRAASEGAKGVLAEHPEIAPSKAGNRASLGQKLLGGTATFAGGISNLAIAQGSALGLSAQLAAHIAPPAGLLNMYTGMREAEKLHNQVGVYEQQKKDGAKTGKIKLPFIVKLMNPKAPREIDVPIDDAITQSKDQAVLAWVKVASGALTVGAGAAALAGVPGAAGVAAAGVGLPFASILYPMRHNAQQMIGMGTQFGIAAGMNVTMQKLGYAILSPAILGGMAGVSGAMSLYGGVKLLMQTGDMRRSLGTAEKEIQAQGKQIVDQHFAGIDAKAAELKQQGQLVIPVEIDGKEEMRPIDEVVKLMKDDIQGNVQKDVDNAVTEKRQEVDADVKAARITGGMAALGGVVLLAGGAAALLALPAAPALIGAGAVLGFLGPVAASGALTDPQTYVGLAKFGSKIGGLASTASMAVSGLASAWSVAKYALSATVAAPLALVSGAIQTAFNAVDFKKANGYATKFENDKKQGVEAMKKQVLTPQGPHVVEVPIDQVIHEAKAARFNSGVKVAGSLLTAASGAAIFVAPPAAPFLAAAALVLNLAPGEAIYNRLSHVPQPAGPKLEPTLEHPPLEPPHDPAADAAPAPAKAPHEAGAAVSPAQPVPAEEAPHPEALVPTPSLPKDASAA